VTEHKVFQSRAHRQTLSMQQPTGNTQAPVDYEIVLPSLARDSKKILDDEPDVEAFANCRMQ
jgi:hypothetical protein